MGYYDVYYRAVVRSVVRLSPNLVRVHLGGGDLDRFVSTDVGDERLCVVFPEPGQRHARGPQRMDDGTEDYPDEADRPEMRSYTVRAFDPDTGVMVIDFVAHEGGVAATWALNAEVGDTVYVTEAAGWYDPPADATWQLLVADLTALPALGRILETLEPGTRAYVLAEVLDEADRQPLSSPADVSVEWLVGTGNGYGDSVLPAAVREFAWPEGPGYVWFAGEAGASREVRKHVRRELGWPVERFEILGYWRVRKEEWTARYEQVGTELEAVYTRAVAQGATSTDALELYDEALERAGL